MQYLLPILLLIPLVGAVGGALMPRWSAGKMWGLATSVAAALVGLFLALNFDWTTGRQQFGYAAAGVESVGFSLRLGVDSISLLMVLLVLLMHLLAVISSFQTIRVRPREYYAWFSVLLFTMLGAFIARDLLLFYFFFELSLIPTFFIILIWGGRDRKTAAVKQFIYLFTGGVMTLTAIVFLGTRAGTFDMDAAIAFAQTRLSGNEQFWVLMGLVIGFGFKTPLVPFHTWLPLAHTEAPTAGSVDLASLVLKLGTYGLIRIALPIGLVGGGALVANASVFHTLAVLSVVGVLSASLAAWVQKDMKRLIAYSSVAHVGLCVLGMLALNDIGMQGSVYYMINHGITTGGLFLIVGMIYNRFHTRQLDQLSGLGKAMPKLAFFFVFFTMASVGLPGTNGFISEFLCLLGAFTNNTLRPYAIVASAGMVLGAVYMLHLTAKVIFGPLVYPLLHGDADSHETIDPAFVQGGDITRREVGMLVPLAVAVLMLGVFPTPILKSMAGPLQQIRSAGVVTAGAVNSNIAPALVDVSSLPVGLKILEQSENPGHAPG